MAKRAISGQAVRQEGAERPRGGREVKTASSGQKGDERPRGRRMTRMDRNIEWCQMSRSALSGQTGVEWLKAKQSGGRLVTGKVPSFSEGS